MDRSPEILSTERKNTYFKPIPIELERLSEIEEKLISRVVLVMTYYRHNTSLQRKYSGHAVGMK